jgi:beta-aspartyl-dipeptidase (metallo-type)
MDLLFQLVHDYHFPIAHISPTHVGRTKELFEQAMEFAKLGGMIDITTGASKYTDPHKTVLLALENGVDIGKLTYSSDGHAGLSKLDETGRQIGFRSAPFHLNLFETLQLIRQANMSPADAFRLITTNPAANLGLKNKGRIAPGLDADMCWFDDQWQLQDVFAHGKPVMLNQTITFNPSECL